jgi:hypothetical protein
MESCGAAPQLNCDRDGAVDQSFYGIISNMTTWLDAFGSVLGIVVAIVLLPVGTWSVYHAFRLALWWPKTSARIVRYWITRSESKPHGQKFYHPVVRFEVADGSRVTTISSWGSWRRSWPVGTTVYVHYDPANPRRVEIRCIGSVWGIPLTVTGLVAGFALFAWLWHYINLH